MASPFLLLATDGKDLGYDKSLVDPYSTVAESGDRRGFVLPTPAGNFVYDGKVRAAWPTTYIDYDTLPAMAGTVRAATNDATLQAAIAASLPGDVITVASGVYTGSYTSWPANGGDTIPGGNGVVTVIWKPIWDSMVANGGVATVRPQKVRAPAAQIGTGAFFQNNSLFNETQWAFDGGSTRGWRFIGLSIGLGPAVTQMGRLIRIGSGDGTIQWTESQCPQNIIFDRCALSGNPNVNLKAGIEFHGKYNVLVDSITDDNIHHDGQDCKAIFIANGPGPFAAINNRLCASTEVILCGGQMVLCGHPTNIDVALNLIEKPFTWNATHPSYAGKQWSLKNLVEFKMGHNVRLLGNVLRRSWPSGQTGAAFLIKSEIYSNGATIGSTRDVIILHNKVYDVSQAVNFTKGDDQGPADPPLNVCSFNNVFEVGAQYFDASSSSLIAVGAALNPSFIHTTVVAMGPVNDIMQPGYAPNLAILDSIIGPTTYGIKGSGLAQGIPTLSANCVGYDVRKTVLVGAPSGSYPPNNYFPPDQASVQYTDFNNRIWSLLGTSQTGSVTPPPPSPVLTTLVVSPTSVAVDQGATQQFTAQGYDQFGVAMSAVVTWSVVAGGGTINGSGLFTAGSTAGTYSNTIRAVSGSVQGFATVIVNAVAPPPPPPTPVLTTVVLTPTSASLIEGQTRQFTAQGYDQFGAAMAATFTWSVVAGGGTISSSGLFTAGGVVGSFPSTVKATSGGISGYASITVTAQIPVLTSIVVSPSSTALQTGGTQQFIAHGYDQNGALMSISPVWSVTGGGAITSSGFYTAGGVAGTYSNSVRATVGAVVGMASVVINAVLPPPPVLTSIEVTPASDVLAPGETQQFTAIGYDQNGAVMAVSPVWSVTSGGGTISSSGLFTAGSTAGSFSNTIRATSGSVFGQASITVVAPPVQVLTSIVLTPQAVNLEVGDSQQFEATGYDQDGVPMSITPVWSVTGGIGTVNSTGSFVAGSVVGTFPGGVKASVGAVVGEALITIFSVTPPPPPPPPPPTSVVTTIVVEPYAAILDSGQQQDFTATAFDQNGYPMSFVPQWQVVAGGGSITQAGRFTAGDTAGVYSGTVRAVFGSVYGSASIMVKAGPDTPPYPPPPQTPITRRGVCGYYTKQRRL